MTILVLSASRTGGSDWENYNSFFKHLAHSQNAIEAVWTNFMYEPGYVLFNYAIQLVSTDRRIYIGVESIINAYAVYLITAKVRGGPIILVYLFPLQFASILGVRQTLAFSILIIAMLSLRKLRGTMIAFAPTIHLSALPLLLLMKLSENRKLLTAGSLPILATFLIAIIAFMPLILLKSSLYFSTTSGLTELKGSEVALSKLANATALVTIYILSGSANKNREVSFLLFTIYLTIIVTSLTTPILARLAPIVEFVIMYIISKSIARLSKKSTKITLIAVIAILSGAKMLKITAQFDEVYEVCFFCGW